MKPIRPRIMTPRHPLWNAFHTALGRNLQIEGGSQNYHVCTHRSSMPATVKALMSVGLSRSSVIATRTLFRCIGLDCDCAVWLNPGILFGVMAESSTRSDAILDLPVEETNEHGIRRFDSRDGAALLRLHFGCVDRGSETVAVVCERKDSNQAPL